MRCPFLKKYFKIKNVYIIKMVKSYFIDMINFIKIEDCVGSIYRHLLYYNLSFI